MVAYNLKYKELTDDMNVLLDNNVSQLKSAHLNILLTSNSDDGQNQTQVILCSTVIFHLFLLLMYCFYSTKLKW